MAQKDLSNDGFHRLEALRTAVGPLLDQFKTGHGFECAFVVLIDPPTAIVRDIIGLSSASPLLDAFGVPPRAPELFLRALEERSAISVEDASHDPRLTTLAQRAHRRAGINRLWVAPLLPVSSVLVVSKPDGAGSESLSTLLGITGQLATLLWQYVGNQEGEETSGSDLAQRDWLRSMLNAVPDPVVLSDEQNNVVYQNDQAKRLFEVHVDDSPGKLRAIELNNFLLSTALSSFVLDQGASLGREFTAVDPIEGSELLFEVICRTIEDPATGQRYLVSVLRNVTDLHRAIEEIRNSLRDLQLLNDGMRYERDRLNLVLENVADPIVVAGPANQVVLMNASAKRLLQPPDDQRTDGSRSAAYYTNDARLMAFLLDLQLSQDDVQRGELQFIEPATGEEMAVSIIATNVKNPLGQLAATVSVLHDLTQVRELERRRVEHQLFESEKLAALGRLAAAVAHEINNPLESIKNALHLLRDDVPESAPDRKFLDIATKETERVSRVIGQMLGFYRGGASAAPVNINGMIEDALLLLQRRFSGKGIKVRTELDRKLPGVTASADQLKQVLLNLVLNAEDVMEGGGELSVVTRRPRGGEKAAFHQEHVLIEVRDTGSGIEPEHLDHIFDPFFSTKRERGGTGLGLWVCYDIIKQHGGEIRVRSRLGQGTTFTIALPIKEQDEQ